MRAARCGLAATSGASRWGWCGGGGGGHAREQGARKVGAGGCTGGRADGCGRAAHGGQAAAAAVAGKRRPRAARGLGRQPALQLARACPSRAPQPRARPPSTPCPSNYRRQDCEHIQGAAGRPGTGRAGRCAHPDQTDPAAPLPPGPPAPSGRARPPAAAPHSSVQGAQGARRGAPSPRIRAAAGSRPTTPPPEPRRAGRGDLGALPLDDVVNRLLADARENVSG